MENRNLYNEILMDHYRHPRNQGMVENANFSSNILNPSCGDSLNCTGIIANNVLISLKFVGKGCVISQAAASLLSEKVKNMDCADIMRLTKNDMISLLSINLGPTRLRCGLLALEALHTGLMGYAQSHQDFNDLTK